MREIKFRAKEKETNTWVYGQLYHYGIKDNDYSYAIIDDKFNVHSVIYDSIQQYTGEHDKDFKEIYEGDIILNTKTLEYGKVIYFNAGFYILLNNATNLSISDNLSIISVRGNSYDTK